MSITLTVNLAGVPKHSSRSRTCCTSTREGVTRTQARVSVAKNGGDVMQHTTAAAFDRGVSQGLGLDHGAQLAITFCVFLAVFYLIGRTLRAAIKSAGRAWRGDGRG